MAAPDTQLWLQLLRTCPFRTVGQKPGLNNRRGPHDVKLLYKHEHPQACKTSTNADLVQHHLDFDAANKPAELFGEMVAVIYVESSVAKSGEPSPLGKSPNDCYVIACLCRQYCSASTMRQGNESVSSAQACNLEASILVILWASLSWAFT